MPNALKPKFICEHNDGQWIIYEMEYIGESSYGTKVDWFPTEKEAKEEKNKLNNQNNKNGTKHHAGTDTGNQARTYNCRQKRNKTNQ
jgi:hypothetical protein